MSSDWNEVVVGDVATLVTKGTTPTTLGFNFEEVGIRFVKVETLSEDGSFLEDKFGYISDAANEALLRSQLQKDDVLFTIAGTIGRTGLVQESHLPANTNQAVAIIRPDKNKVDPRFLRYVLSNRAFIQNTQSKTVQSVQANFSLGELKKANFNLPNMTMQKSIVSVLGSLDDRISLLLETNATLEAIAQAIFKSWFVDFDPVRAKAEGKQPEGMDADTAALFPDGFEETNLGMIPKGWSAGTIADLMRLHKGSVNPALHPDVEFQHFSLPSYDDGMMPVIEQGRSIKSNKTSVPENAVLVSKLNPHIPRVWLPSEVVQNSVCSTEFLPFIPSQNSSTTFIYCLLAAPDFLQSLCQLVTGTSNSHQRIKPDGILTMRYVVPSSNAIDAFDSVTKPLIQRVKLNQLKAKSLSKLRDALLPKLISGNLRITESVLEVD